MEPLGREIYIGKAGRTSSTERQRISTYVTMLAELEKAAGGGSGVWWEHARHGEGEMSAKQNGEGRTPTEKKAKNAKEANGNNIYSGDRYNASPVPQQMHQGYHVNNVKLWLGVQMFKQNGIKQKP